MNIWENTVITNKGMALQAKTLIGNSINITSIKTGAGKANLFDLKDLTDVLDEKQEITLQPITDNKDGTLSIPVLLSNDELESGYTLWQLGFYAEDPDEGEILYAISQAIEPKTVPSKDEMTGYTIQWNFLFAISNDLNMTVNIDPAGLVTLDTLATFVRATEDTSASEEEPFIDPVTLSLIRENEQTATNQYKLNKAGINNLDNIKAPKDLATEETPGLMSSEDKVKVNSVEDGANNYEHPDTHPATMIVEDTTHRFMTDEEKKKLDGIADGANKYTHPSSHPASMITQDATHRFMTDEERTKLSGIAAGANKYTHPSTSGNKHIPSGGSAGQFLKWSEDGTAVWSKDNNTTYSPMKGCTADAAGSSGLVPAPAIGQQTAFLRGDGIWAVPPNTTYGTVTETANGLMLASDKKKLDGIADGANKYTHPSSHPASMITQDATHRFATDAEKTKWNGMIPTSSMKNTHTNNTSYVPTSALAYKMQQQINELLKDSGWVAVKYGSGISTYDDSNLEVRRIGKIVFCTGVVTNSTSWVSHSSFFTVPYGYRPPRQVTVISQGSGTNRYLLTIQANGIAKAERYSNTTSNQTVPANSWFPIWAVWFIE